MPIQLSGCAIINDNDELLVLWKRKHQHYEFPGGKVEAGESLEDTAKRECGEELGVDIQVRQYLGHEDFVIDGKAFQSHKFLGELTQDQVPKVNEPERFEKIFWMPISEHAKHVCAPNVREFCLKYLNGEIEGLDA